jgi:hypothetical protein
LNFCLSFFMQCNSDFPEETGSSPIKKLNRRWPRNYIRHPA